MDTFLSLSLGTGYYSVEQQEQNGCICVSQKGKDIWEAARISHDTVTSLLDTRLEVML